MCVFLYSSDNSPILSITENSSNKAKEENSCRWRNAFVTYFDFRLIRGTVWR